MSLSLGRKTTAKPEEPRASGVKRVPAKGEFLPKAESPTEDTAQRGQATGQGEPLPSPRTPSGPTTAAAAAENLTSGDQGGKSGGPLPDESQATGAGAAPKEAAASKTEQVDDSEDEYTSESTEEVPALQGTPLTTGGGPHVVSKPVSSDAATGQAFTVGRVSPRAHPVVSFGLWENPSSFLPPGQCASQHS